MWPYRQMFDYDFVIHDYMIVIPGPIWMAPEWPMSAGARI
jgi:hypothetical protein